VGVKCGLSFYERTIPEGVEEQEGRGGDYAERSFITFTPQQILFGS
jgi:hypothetical protein